MNLAWLRELLPGQLVTPRTKILWALFFLLFPAAYFVGVRLEEKEESPAVMMRAQDRDASIRRAEAFAANKGISVAGWHRYAIVDTRQNLLDEYDAMNDGELQALSTLVPAQEVQVLFRSPDHQHEFRVFLSLYGLVTGFDFGKANPNDAMFSGSNGVVKVDVKSSNSHRDEDDGRARDPHRESDQKAEQIARAALADDETFSKLLHLGKAEVNGNEDDPNRREVSWDTTVADHPELSVHVAVSVREGEVVAEHVTAKTDHESKKSKQPLPALLMTIYSSFLSYGAFSGIWRYTKRMLQKEVSHVRTLVVAALFSISCSIWNYCVFTDQVAMRLSAETFAKVYIPSLAVGAIVIGILGLLVGIAYGSGEGALRESYPTKLTSLDSLLAGKPFSKNAAASILFGGAAAGWMLLLHQSIQMFLPHDMASSRADVLTYTFARLPWLTLLVGRQYDSLLIAVSGLVLPAPFLLRDTKKRKKRRYFWLIVFAVFSVLRDAAKYQSTPGSLVAIVILVCALLLPFFAFDLLAAIASLSSLAFVTQLAWLSAVFPSWNTLSIWLAVVGGLVLVISAFLALRGQAVLDEDVRPTYAKNLAERMSLQAEVSAAREAQLRLLPQAAPKLPGAQIAACCLPAREVGGDFYDFFPLDANRTGVFIAQGGNEGLASALCIALAKGVLMHDALLPQPPCEIVSGLSMSMAQLLEGGTGRGISFAYGVLDVRRRTLSYARTGSSPRVVITRADTAARPVGTLERLVIAGAFPIYEGLVNAQPGDLVVVYTQGVTKLRVKRFARREFQWLELVRRELAKQENALERSLMSALGRYQNQAQEDLTAVLIRMEPSEVVAQEGVA